MQVQRLDLANRRDVRRYIQLPFKLYRESDLWVPPFVSEMRDELDPGQHPFYQHSQAAFFFAVAGGEVVGRIGVLDNAHYNQYHGERAAFFTHFDVVDDSAVSGALFDAAFDWARGRGLERMLGPLKLIPSSGKGLLVEGFAHRPALGVPYNHAYYGERVADAGFEKLVDLISCYLDQALSIPQRILRVAEKVKARRGFRVVRFRTKGELRAMVPRVTQLYNDSFTEVHGYVPLTEAEAHVMAQQILAVADPTLTTVLMKGDAIVGFILAYPDPSAGIQRCRGRLWPFGWYHLLRAFKRTRWLNINGAGILAPYRGLGGNALLYAELYHTVTSHPRYYCADLVQIQESNMRMVRELEAMEARPYKRHRVYQRWL